MPNSAVLIVEDDVNLREALFDTLSSDKQPVLTAGSGPEALSILNAQQVGLVVSDLQMEPMDGHTLLGKIRERYPALPAILMTAYGTIDCAVDAMRNGAADFLVKPFEADELKSIVGKYLKPALAFDQPIAADPRSFELLRISEKVARSAATVTLTGESGCGKEVFARFIHAKSTRSDQPFIAINCAAIPENMLEAVLFGYEKGAFTGAGREYAGKFEQADRGTLLLDEISEMDLSLQAKLLRVIQEKEVERIGGRKVIPLDVRVLATTNRDLRQAVANREFREDLYYRLNVFPLHIPPLRERRADIIPLAEMALCRHAILDHGVVVLSDSAQERMLAYDWPGNVRELENLIQRSLILLQGNTLNADDLSFDADSVISSLDGQNKELQQGVKNHEYQLILDALQTSNGRRAAAARSLGISPRTLRYKLARMRSDGIAIPEANIDVPAQQAAEGVIR